jgi:hypothetical protein
MEKRDGFTKFLAIAGTVLTVLPVLAPVLFGVMALIGRGRFLFDYLMPAELFFLVLIGGGLLLWAALRARAQRKIVLWSLSGAVALLVISQLVAVVSGLASGKIDPEGFWFVLVIAMLILYIAAVIALAVGGILLVRDLFKPTPPAVTVG